MSDGDRPIPPATPPVFSNVNGLVGTVFSSVSLFGWAMLFCSIVSYEVNVPKPIPTGDEQRDSLNQVGYRVDQGGQKLGAFLTNSLVVIGGGALSGAMLLVGLVVSGIGFGFPNKTLPTIGVLVGALSGLLGICFLAWRYSVLFG